MESLLPLYFSTEISTFSLLVYWNHEFLLTFLLKPLLSLYFSSGISTSSLLFFWNLYFPFTFLLKSLPSLYFSVGISTFSHFLITFLLKSLLFDNFPSEISIWSLSYWNLYFLFTFPLKSLYFHFSCPLKLKSFEISTFSLLFYGRLYFLFTFLLNFWNLFLLLTFLLKSLLSLYFSIEISAFFVLFLKPLLSLDFPIGTSSHRCPCTTSAPALHCESNHALLPDVTTHAKISKKSYAQTRQTRSGTSPPTASHTTTFRAPVHSDLLWKHRGAHTSLLSNLHIVPRLPHKVQPVSWAT